MHTLWTVWVVAAAAILFVGGVSGVAVKGTPLGLLIDGRGRYSLNRLQLLWWLWIIVSMAAGVVAARFTVDGARPLGFSIPGPVLALLGTAGATTVASSAVKAYRDSDSRDTIAAALPGGAFLGQLLLQEEGANADQTLDVGKFQALIITLLLGAAYTLTAIYTFLGRDTPPVVGPGGIIQLPDLDPTFVALLAVSSASYVGTKLVSRSGQPPYSLTDRDQEAAQVLADARAEGVVLDGRGLQRVLRARAKARRKTRLAGPAPARVPGPAPEVGGVPLGAPPGQSPNGVGQGARLGGRR